MGFPHGGDLEHESWLADPLSEAYFDIAYYVVPPSFSGM